MRFISRIFAIVFFTILIIGCENNYESGLKLLGENKLFEAIQSFKKVKSNDKDYSNALSKMNYIYGIQNYNDSNYSEAMKHLAQVRDNDKYKVEANNLMIFISATMIKNINMDSAIVLFNSIPTNSELYIKTREEIDQLKSDKFNSEEHKNYLKAVEEYEKGNEEKSLLMLNNISTGSKSYMTAQDLIKNIEELKEIRSHTTIAEVSCEWLPMLGTYDLFINGKKFDTNIENKNKPNSLFSNIFLARIPIQAIEIDKQGYINLVDQKLSTCKKRVDWDSPFGSKSIHDEITNTFYLGFENLIISVKDIDLVTKLNNNRSGFMLFFLYTIKEIMYVDITKWDQNVYFKVDLLSYHIIDRKGYLVYNSKTEIE